MIKQLLLDELARLTNTHEVIEEKQVYIESIKKLIYDLTANRDKLDRDFQIMLVQEELIAKKQKSYNQEYERDEAPEKKVVYTSDDMVHYVL